MNRVEIWMDDVFLKHRWLIHTFFWLFILGVYVLFFGHQSNNYLQTLFFVGLLMPVTIGTTYFLNYSLIPRYPLKERYGYFFLYFSYTLLASIYVEMIIVILTFIILAESKITNMSPASVNIIFLLVALLMVVFLSTAIKMLLHWRKSREEYQKLMTEKIETELKFLKTQLHPHFLFNTLNNLYYLALNKSDKAPQAILSLSELLDYVLHDTKSNFVSLEKELKQVENYIALEVLRYEERLTINIIKEKVEEQEIVPMVLITLMENAFKHGVAKTSGKAWIELSLSSRDRFTYINIKNSVGSKKKLRSENGIGLDNLRSQLNHIYSNRARLSVEENADFFSVELQLENNK